MTSQVAISNLDAEHLIPLQRSLQQIFSTKLAEVTLAQVVDGIPTEQIDTQYMSGCDEVISGRTKPTDEAFEELARWRSTFQLEDLMIGSDVVQNFQNTDQGTPEFQNRLIEMIGVCVHKIAAQLFTCTNQPPYKCREPEYIEPFPIPQIPGFEDPEPPRPVLLPEKPTYLYHVNYVVHEQYPMGVADMVGYWVEYRVLGGVVLFDRGESENELRDVYLHPSAGFRVFKLSEGQIDQLLSFCLDSEGSIPCPFPMTAERNAVRVYCDDTFDLHIFRDKYERNRPVYPVDRTQPARRIHLEDDPDRMDRHLRLQEFVRQMDKASSNQ